MGIQINGVSNKISSGSQIDFPGSVGVAGTLTYEDVTNIDSIGIVTARTGIKIGPTAGVAGTFFADGSYVTAGVVTATTFHGSGANLTNLDASDLASGTVPTARLGSGTANNTTFLRGDSTFQTVNTDLVADTSPQLGGNLDANSKNILFGDTSGSSNNRLKFGAGPDLEISHNGTDSIIQDAGTGDLKIGGSIVRLTNAAINENMLVATENGAVEIYFDNSKKMETVTGGVYVYGDLVAGVGGSGNFSIGDSQKIMAGNGNDIQIYHNGTDSYIANGTNNFRIGNTGSTNLKFFTNNSTRWNIDGSGHFIPDTTNAVDIGSSSVRVRNIYTQDLQLSNEAKKDKGGNDIDGTWGDWTLQEGESDVYMINNRSGKKFRIKMEEV